MHAIAKMVDGRDAFAFVGAKGWHGLGQQLKQGASVEEWAQASGLLFKIQRAFVRFATERNGAADGMVSDKVVLFRDDTKAPLGVTSDSYKIVQPIESLQFFEDWISAGGCHLETAGVLFEGKRWFAMAKLSDAVDIGDGDFIAPYVLFSTSADGSLATEVRFTTVRVVCNNTLGAARAAGKASFKLTHRSKFDASEARTVVESANKTFAAFLSAARALRAVNLSAMRAQDMTARLLVDAKTAAVDTVEDSRGYQQILALFNGGAKGASLPGVKGTAWGWLNSVTEYTDHHIRARSDEHRFASAQDGAGAKLKAQALDMAMTIS